MTKHREALQKHLKRGIERDSLAFDALIGPSPPEAESVPPPASESDTPVDSTTVSKSDTAVESDTVSESTTVSDSIPAPTARAASIQDVLDRHGNVKVAPSGRYSPVPWEVDDLLAMEQTPAEQCVYRQLFRLSFGFHNTHCFVGQTTLARRANLSKSTLRNATKGLIKKDHIAELETINEKNRKGTVYRVFLPHEILRPAKGTSPHSPISSSNTPSESDTVVKSTTVLESNTVVENTVSKSDTVSKSNTIKNENLRTVKNIEALSPIHIVQGFYSAIGQSRISKTKQERAEGDIQELLQDFQIDDIAYAAEWTANHKKDIRDFALVKHTIGEALADRDRDKKRRQERAARG